VAGEPVDIVVGWDCALWFAQTGENTGVGRITTAGAITQYAVGNPFAHVSGITVALDGNIWFTETFANRIGRLETDKTNRLCAGRQF
ncbi:MAG TPA: hypothetical protein VJ653_01670, partial [Acidimicrobiales bacterium]|nr:hypothetical protein [Acidimicrobiales bacterium]